MSDLIIVGKPTTIQEAPIAIIHHVIIRENIPKG